MRHREPGPAGTRAVSADEREALDETASLSPAQARALVGLLEAAPQVRRRHHFFVWLQTHVHTLLPHVLAACGSYQRNRRRLLFECFQSVAVPEPLLDTFADADSALMAGVARCWVQGHGRPCVLLLDAEGAQALQADVSPLRDAGLGHLLVHGVARPQRPSEIESLFVFAGPGTHTAPQLGTHLDLVVPHLHATYLRVLDVERDLQQPPRAPAAPGGEPRRMPITARERQVLQGVREGQSNQQIGESLGISALTVKNHIQKILRKLGAHNRAQAVAMTMSMSLGPATGVAQFGRAIGSMGQRQDDGVEHE